MKKWEKFLRCEKGRKGRETRERQRDKEKGEKK
jgi:hypothetical protein